MKRDMILVREILKNVEAHPANGRPLQNIAIDGFDEPTINRHVQLLVEAGYIDGQVISGGDGIAGFSLRDLTWDGHEFANAAKDETIWNKAKTTILKHGSSITIDVLFEWLKAEGRKHLPLP